MPIYLQHFRVQLALHCLREADGPVLLLLHALGEQSPAELPVECSAWPGSVYALDFTGHGASGVPSGGGYTCEALMADADAALAHLGAVTLVGRGLGAYVAVMLAGARPELVRGTVLCDGPGLLGGSMNVDSMFAAEPVRAGAVCADPRAVIELAAELRPPTYATAYAQNAAEHSGLTQAFAVCGAERPDWLTAIMAALSLPTASVAESLAHYAHAILG